MSYLTFNNVSKIYTNDQSQSKQYAVNKANFTIDKGELVVFVGPSGCGKSTFLRMIAGLEDISEGGISLDGQIINDIEVSQREIAMVFQDYALYPHMTVKENLSFGLENQKKNKQDILDRVKHSEEILELESLDNRFPKQLSGGQRQRVALGRALVKEPKVFLLDEPLSNLDAKLRVQTRKMIASLHKELNATMIYVTHDQVEAMTLGDKIVVMNQGVIQQISTPEELYFDPQNAFVANFIGTPSMNLIKTPLLDDCSVNIGPYSISLERYKQTISDLIGEEVIVGIRPEDIAITPHEDSLSGRANHIEFLGSENLLYFTFDQGEIIVKLQEAKKLDPSVPYRLHFDPQTIYLFNSQDQTRIYEQ